MRWNANLDDASIDDLAVINHTTVGGNFSVTGFANVSGTFAVNTAVSVTYPSASSRTITLGAGTTDSDRLLIKSQVGNNSRS